MRMVTEETEIELLEDLSISLKFSTLSGAPVCLVSLIRRGPASSYIHSVLSSVDGSPRENYREVIYSRSFSSPEELAVLSPVLRDSLRYVLLLFSRFIHSEGPSGLC
jgi:hypothetical protein